MRRLETSLALTLALPFALAAQEARPIPELRAPAAPTDRVLRLLSFDGLSGPGAQAQGAAIPHERSIPMGWEEIRFSDDLTTVYETGPIMGQMALCSISRASASALAMEVAYDPLDYPILRFWLRVENTVPGGDLTQKDGDDFAARIFVNFAFESSEESIFSRLSHTLAEGVRGRRLPGHALNYVWGNVAPVGTQAESAYSDRVSLVVVRSGAQRATWHRIERNIVEDYEAAFGKLPPAVTGVGIMTDSDDTGTEAAGCFGEISAIRRRR